LRDEYEIDIGWRAFPLHPDTPLQGLSLEELFKGRPVDVPKMVADLKRRAEDLGLPYGRRERTFNSRLAQELGKYAESLGLGDSYHDAVFRAYFADGQNIADLSTLLELGTSVGMSEAPMRHVLETRAFKDAVDSDWRRSRVLGINAVPTFMINHQVLVGAQPYKNLVMFMEHHRINRRRDP
jgi:predicted DsbA family dithiol-disulfide isomerase